MVGVNIGVAAPMAFFPFAGWKNSFFGDLHAHGKDAVSFYTEQKVIMSRTSRRLGSTAIGVPFVRTIRSARAVGAGRNGP